jgi:predicted NACHT family NTPase
MSKNSSDVSSQKFLNSLFSEENKQIRELAITPILLSLTCAVFYKKKKFYSKRSKLYEEGLEILLDKWDKSREIERDEIYRDLSLDRKLELLSYLAAKKFEQLQYVLFEQEELEKSIAEFLGIELRDSRTVLKAIESQHGLLIERSQKVWSFSHLTFQEYLVAKCFCEQDTWESFVIHIWKPHWSEVFILAVGIVDFADNLLFKMLEETNKLPSEDKYLQQFLVWLNKKSRTVKYAFREATVRVYYFSLYLFYVTGILKNSHSLSPELHNLTMLTYNSARAFKNDPDDTRAIDTTLDYDLMLTLSQSNGLSKDSLLVRALRSSMNLAAKLDFKLYSLLNNLESQLPDFELEIPQKNSNRENYQGWWIENGERWTKELVNIIIEHRNIGHDWQLSEKQKEILLQYDNSNGLILNCLNSFCLVSNDLRKEIENTLLRPIAEIEKYKRDKSE